MSPYNEIIGATAAGCASTAIGHPLDTIKVHLQSTSSAGGTGTLSISRKLFRQNALFRGIGPPLFNSIIMNTVMFGVFRSVNDACESPMTAGLVSGFATAFISTPTDYAKIQAQLKGVNSLDLVLQTVRRSPSSLFRGHTVNLGREGVFTMVYLGCYDKFQPQGFLQVAAVSSVTGGMAWVASFPLDSIKTVVQGSDVSIRLAIARIAERGGLSAFYRGCLSSTGRAVLVTSLRMIAYDATNHWLE